MTPKPYKLVVHPLFSEYAEDMEELRLVVTRFLEGDCGDLSGEDRILGFMRRSLNGNARYAVYETETCGRVHVLAKNPEILVLPDLVYASEYGQVGRDLNTCDCLVCSETTEAEPTTPTTTHYGNS